MKFLDLSSTRCPMSLLTFKCWWRDDPSVQLGDWVSVTCSDKASADSLRHFAHRAGLPLAEQELGENYVQIRIVVRYPGLLFQSQA